ncbi:MAG: outer membrane protein assembly factor BamA, partial [Spirochaetes bacterium]
EATTNDLLFTDGMTIARGWPWMQDGEAMWDNWLELRMPVSERVLWSDIFLSGTGFWNQLNDVKSMNISDFKFSMGAGIRFVIPGLPIGLYFTKRFSFDDNSNIQWEGGSIFRSADNPDSGLDLVIAFTTGMF